MTLCRGRFEDNIDQLSASNCNVEGDERSACDRSLHDATVLQRLRCIELNVDHNLGRKSRELKRQRMGFFVSWFACEVASPHYRMSSCH